MNYLIIVNHKIPKETRKRLDSLGKIVDIPKGVPIEDLIEGEYDALVSVGGDGTASKTAKTAFEQKVPLAVLPYGTGNDFYNAVAGGDVLDALESGSLREEKSDALLFSADGKQYLSVVGIHLGLFGKAANLGGAWGFVKKLVGKNAYLLRGTYDLLTHDPENVTLKVDDKTYEGKIWAAQFANTPTTGGGKVGMPGVSPNDGKLDVIYVPGDIRRRKLPLLIPKLKDVSQVEEAHLLGSGKYFSVEGQVTAGYDGEYIGKVSDIVGKIEEGAIRVLVPGE